MIPSTLAGLVLFVMLLAPGVVYELRREKYVSREAVSQLKEVLRVIIATLLCDAFVLLLFIPVRVTSPRSTPDLSLWIRRGNAYWGQHGTLASYWILGALLVSCLVGYTAADPRITSRTASLGKIPPFRWFTPPRISGMSAWENLMNAFAGSVEPVHVYVGCQMSDGSYVSGPLFTMNTNAAENTDRDLVLVKPILLRQAGSDDAIELPSVTFTVISARNISRLDFSYFTSRDLFPGATQQAAGGSPTTSQRNVPRLRAPHIRSKLPRGRRPGGV